MIGLFIGIYFLIGIIAGGIFVGVEGDTDEFNAGAMALVIACIWPIYAAVLLMVGLGRLFRVLFP